MTTIFILSLIGASVVGYSGWLTGQIFDAGLRGAIIGAISGAIYPKFILLALPVIIINLCYLYGEYRGVIKAKLKPKPEVQKSSCSSYYFGGTMKPAE